MDDARTLWQWFEEILQETDPVVRRVKSETFWRIVLQRKCNPICVGNQALFVFSGTAQFVAVVGEWSYWQQPEPMQNIDGTTLFYCKLQFPEHSRLQYKLICDDAWIVDPANAVLAPEGFGVNSEFQMPHYRPSMFDTMPSQATVPKGVVQSSEVQSQIYGARSLWLYTPPNADSQTLYPLLIVHDGEEALRLGQFHRLLDTLIVRNIVEPCVALFIPPRFRNAEYTDVEQYSRFCFTEALPYARKQWEQQGIQVAEDPNKCIVMGASLAGRLATIQLLFYPHLLGGCIAQSPSYWWRQGDVFRLPQLRNAAGKTVILQTGTIADAQQLTRRMYEVLLRLNAKVILLEYAQGHSWSNWRSNFGDAVVAWIGKPHQQRQLWEQQRRKVVGESVG